jgi:GxxExxY protein
MNDVEDNLIYPDLSYKVMGLAMSVHRELGPGFMEKVYENALMLLLNQNSIPSQQQIPLKVMFKGVIVGDYIADILVDDKIIIELKACEKMDNIHKAQVINYLKATNKKLGLLINFGKKSLEYERLINC